MVTIKPIGRALVPVNSTAAGKICGKNYDEFQDDREIWEVISANPSSILKITMAHCDAPSESEMLQEGSEEALEKSYSNFKELMDSDQTAFEENILVLYQIYGEGGIDQTGVLGFAKTAEIRTPSNPNGTIIRNENIYEKKAANRAKLIGKTSSYIGIVNNVVDDNTGRIEKAIDSYKNSCPPTYEVTDEAGFFHRIWIIKEQGVINNFVTLLKEEPYAYVADGNHRSAAAASLGRENYMAIFFPKRNLRILHYNRLINETAGADFLERLGEDYSLEIVDAPEGYQPKNIHEIGLYLDGRWIKLTAKPELYQGRNAAEQIDSDIVQKTIILKLFKISELTDKRINFVGGDRDAAYLMRRVNKGDYKCALALAPVTMEQFINVCKENLLMPPKSTWFSPKVRSGLVIALFE